MQVLFEEGEEMGRHAGLGLLPGRVIRFSFPAPPPRPGEGSVLRGGSDSPPRPREGADRGRSEGKGSPLKIPHTGWNQIEPTLPSPLLHGLPPGAWAYFNHAYFCQTSPAHVLAITDYGGPFPSVVGLEHITGIQFHPEKSQHVGLHILKNFVERVG
jgi:glutamine amidotransferase